MISDAKLRKLPDSPGVYAFKGRDNKILYIGKATSIRNRVRSYFSSNIAESRGQLILRMIGDVIRVDFVETDSVLEALILEAKLIKKHQPPYNTKEKDDKSFAYVVITREKFPRILVIRGRELENKNAEREYSATYGPFTSGSALREAMKIIRRTFPYRDKCKPADEQKRIPRPCFNRQIGLCPGVCSGEIAAKEYAKTIRNIKLFFDGRKKQILKSLEKEMSEYVKREQFERASQVNKTIFALRHIQDVSLIKSESTGPLVSSDKIEAYDIAHLAGRSSVGVMVVVESGQKDLAQYRMFRIRKNTKGDDLAALEEVLIRRFSHPEWSLPALIVIDGGQTHLDFAKNTLQRLNLKIPIVSVVKDDSHKPKDLLGEQATIDRFRQAILLANSEAHRFAMKYHRNLRDRNFLNDQ